MQTWLLLTAGLTVALIILLFFPVRLWQEKKNLDPEYSFMDYIGDNWKKVWIPLLVAFLATSFWGSTKESRQAGGWHAANVIQCSIQSGIRNTEGAFYSWWENDCLYPTKSGMYLGLKGFRGFGESGEEDGGDTGEE